MPNKDLNNHHRTKPILIHQPHSLHLAFAWVEKKPNDVLMRYSERTQWKRRLIFLLPFPYTIKKTSWLTALPVSELLFSLRALLFLQWTLLSWFLCDWGFSRMCITEGRGWSGCQLMWAGIELIGLVIGFVWLMKRRNGWQKKILRIRRFSFFNCKLPDDGNK